MIITGERKERLIHSQAFAQLASGTEQTKRPAPTPTKKRREPTAINQPGRDKLMTKAKVKKAGAKRKAAQDALTAERVHAILSDPAAPKKVRNELTGLVRELYEHSNAFLSETPQSVAQLFADSAAAVRRLPKTSRLLSEAAPLRERIVGLAERHEPEEYKAARRVRAAYDAQDEREGPQGKGCHFFMERFVDPLMSESDDQLVVGTPRDELFPPLFVRAAAEYRGEPGPNRWTDLLAILDRAETEEGFDFEKEREGYERQRAAASEEYKAEELAKPEPKDKTSDAWRYWKLRQVEHAFEGGDSGAYAAAWDYYRELLFGLAADENFFHVSHARALLPHLITVRQYIDMLEPAPRPRRAKATKKGGARK